MKITILSFVLLLLFSTLTHAEPFETNSVVKAEYRQNSPTTGEVLLTMKEGWHVNANPASMDFLIPVEITLPQDPQALQTSYPVGHAIVTPLGDLVVYSETVSIPVTLKKEQKSGSITLTAQACDGSTCYPPSTWEFPLENAAGKPAHYSLGKENATQHSLPQP